MPENKRGNLFLNLALACAAAFFAVELLTRIATKIEQVSYVLARADWNALINFGILAIMLAYAIKIATGPLIRFLRQKPN
jgi:hypothetical protein